MKYIKKIATWIIFFFVISTPKVVNGIDQLEENKQKSNLLNNPTFPSKFITVQKRDLLRTPNMGIKFLQGQEEGILQEVSTEINSYTTRAFINNEPFEMIIPDRPRDVAVKICAFTSDSIFNQLIVKESEDLTLYFRPRNGINNSDADSETLYLRNNTYNYFDEDKIRITDLRSYTSSIYISKIKDIRGEIINLNKFKGKIFFVIYVDKNKDKIINYGEYEFIVLNVR